MITFLGTVHPQFNNEDFTLDGKVKVEHFDKIFTEGVSDDTELFKKRVNGAVEDLPKFESLEAEHIDRGPEPEAFDDIDAEVVYLDEQLPKDLLIQLAEHTSEQDQVIDVYPFDNLEEQLIRGNDARSDYIEFFRGLRDLDFKEDDGFSSYAALDDVYFERLLKFSAAHLDRNRDDLEFLDLDNSDDFIAGLDEYNITFQDYVDVFGEERNDFQDKRDSHWYEQITSEIEEDENILVIAGIQHVLDYEGSVRNLVEQDQRVAAWPYGSFESEFNPF